jgi:hypothetical protein
VTGAFARPFGIIGQNVYRTIRYRTIWRTVFVEGSGQLQEEREPETDREPLP